MFTKKHIDQFHTLYTFDFTIDAFFAHKLPMKIYALFFAVCCEVLCKNCEKTKKGS